MKKRLFFCSLMVLSISLMHAQMPALKFFHYGKSSGLNQGSVNTLLQDSEGIMWTGNFGGINSFDGYIFESYVNDFEDSTSISDNSVWAIYEDDKKNLWFGTKSGFSRFNRHSQNFENYYIQKPGTNTLAVKAIYQTLEGKLLVGSEGKGLYEFETSKKTFMPISNFPSHLKVTSITEDNKGSLWVGTENAGLYCLANNEKIPKNYRLVDNMDLTTIWSILSDDKGNIWIGTDNEGLLLWDSVEQSFTKVLSPNGSYIGGKKIKTLEKDEKGRIWIGSATTGLSIYDPKNDSFQVYSHIEGNSNTIIDNDISDIQIGQNGVIWIGTYMNGFDKAIETPFHTIRYDPSVKNGLSNNNVYCMYKDQTGNLWFGTFGGGLNLFNKENNTFTHYRHDPDDPSSISHDWIRIVYEDNDGGFWVGTWGGGLNKLDRSTGKFKRYLPNPHEPDNSLNLNIVTALYEDNLGDMWVGTYGGGINIYQPETDDFRSIKNVGDDPHSLSDNHITSFYQNDPNYLWICTYGGGINQYDYKTGLFKRYVPDRDKEYSLNNYKVLHVFPDADGLHWWLTTLGGGLNKFEVGKNKFEAFTSKNGLPDNTTMGMLKDDHGYWISTNSGLSYFDLRDESFTNYSETDGLGSDDFGLEAYMKDDDGIFYFGGKKGITYFDPKEVILKKTFPKVDIRKVSVDGDMISSGGKEYIVPYKSRVSFDFAAINPGKIEKVSYAYKIQGLINDWQYIGRQRHVEFASLKPGNYTLEVKSTNSAGLWNPAFTSLDFHIPAPWYMTWYFRVGLVLSIVLSAFTYYRYKVSVLKRQKVVLEHKVAERTKEITEQNARIEASYKKLKRLEGFKETLVHMIAHDLKNPLVTILGKSEMTHNKSMKKIHQSGQNMLRLIEDMLDVQKFEKDSIKLDPIDIPVMEIIDKAIAEVQYVASDKQINIRYGVSRSLVVNADADLCMRVISNLLSNALKFSKFGETINIQATKEQGRVIIEVQDFGEGISEEAQKYIFEKFKQGKSVNYGKSRSVGLGLAFCKLVVEAHEGNIGVRSSLDKGSTFYFDLPISVVTPDSNNVVRDVIQSTKRVVLSEADIKVISAYQNEIKELTVYETGAWYQIIDSIKSQESEHLNIWCDELEKVLIHFDEPELEKIKQTVTNIYH